MNLDASVGVPRRRRMGFVSTYPFHWWAGCEDLWSGTALFLAKSGFSLSVMLKSAPGKHTPKAITELVNSGARLYRCVIDSICACRFSNRSHAGKKTVDCTL